MAIQIEKRFSVDAPPERVWAFLTDPHRVARTLPGAEITGQIDEQTYAGKMTVKVGPVSSSYKGKVRFERLDPEARTAEITGRGQDIRGRGGAEMRMTSRLTAEGSGTEVTVTSEVNVTGILAQFGRGMIQDVSDQLFQVFTERMRSELERSNRESGGGAGGTAARESEAASRATPDQPEALDVVSLGVKAAIRRPALWVVVAIVVLVVSWWWLR